MSKEVSRREFIAGTVGAVSAYTITSNPNSSVRFINSVTNKFIDKNSINISLFQTSKVSQMNKDIHNSNMYVLNLCKEIISQELTNLQSTVDMPISINLSNHIIPSDIIDKTSMEKAFSSWESYFVNNISDEEKSLNANLLISDIPEIVETKGLGQFPCSCRNHAPISLLLNIKPLVWSNMTKLYTEKSHVFSSSSELFTTSTLLHEIGHNLGLTHDMGYAKYDKEQKIIKSSPMLSSYIYEDNMKGIENYFGDEILNIDEYDNIIVKYEPSFNPKINYEHIQYDII